MKHTGSIQLALFLPHFVRQPSNNAVNTPHHTLLDLRLALGV